MADSICVGCGMCCDGTLFSRAILKPNDKFDRLGELGFEVERNETEIWFHQPCHAFGDGCCTVYTERPLTCRGFRCELLIEHEDRGLAEADARRAIEQATTRRDRIRAAAADLLGAEAASLPMAHLFTRLNEVAATEQGRSQHAQLLLDVAALDLLLKRRFAAPRTAENDES